MTIRHLKVFICVYDHMSITRAAGALHMTQPVVTRTIKELENHYNMLFFDRINQRLYATEAGKRFYSHAKRVISAFDAMEADTYTSSEHFCLSIGATYSLGNYLLPSIIKDLQEHFPHASIRASVMNISSLQRALSDNELDFAIVEDHINDAHLNSEVFFKDRLVLILPKDHPLSRRESIFVQDLQDLPFLMREKGSANRRRLDDMLSKHSITVRPVLESYSTQVIFAAITKGLGVSLLPEYLAAPWAKAGLVESCPLADQPMVRKNFIIWNKEKNLSPQIHESMRICHQAAMRLRESKA
ncbi:MAG: LysR family transcriptional regulator [Clostridia bacterium]|nr:LysR family transcriptional regulator [Clostridia bacterium]